jgi:PKHD-type hydroxylase
MQYYKNSFVFTNLTKEDYDFVKNFLANQNNFITSGSGGESQSVIRKSKISWIKDEKLKHLMFKYIKYENINLGWNWDLDFIEPLQYTIYDKDDYYNYHTDEGGWHYNKEKMRKISFTLTLNDNYEGGEFELENLFFYDEKYQFKKEIKKYVLPENTLLIFHSDLIHKVCPIIKGRRESLVGWISGPPFV